MTKSKNITSPRVYLETYGCQMNIADSQTVSAILGRAGFVKSYRPEDADVILLNTCAIREHAEERVLGRLSDLARLKNDRPGLKLGLLGCVAQNHRAALAERAPWLDLIAGPDAYRRLPELLGSGSGDPVVDVRLDRDETYAEISPAYDAGVRAYVTVMRGCDKFCSFCVVPYVRGRERSLPPLAILREVDQLATRGVKEVVLLGQTVNAYRYGDTEFGALLRSIARIDGIERIRFTSPHPSDMSEALIDAIAAEPKVQPYLHLPVQSGSDALLAAMDRGYTVDQYRNLVARLRGRVAELALSTDIIVGYHGETERDFDLTLDLMREINYDSAFTFKYSVRQHTRAYRLGDSVSEAEKSRRLATLIELQEMISLERNCATIGREFPVLVEGPARRGNGMMAGKTPQFKTAVFKPARQVAAGETVMARVVSATAHSLTCSLS
jgi:tRNA-2-methylthio-N6-dimethylallyladenosine synthase